MCQAKVYIESGDGSKVVAEGVINLRVEGDTVYLSRFFEEPVVVRAVVKEADFLKHTVTLMPMDEAEDR
jgi:predicted RNA-binding protein